MGFVQDYFKPFFNKRELRFIESVKVSDNVYSFLFHKEQDIHWQAGQYGLFRIIHKTIKNDTRPFSVSSAPHESVIRITTRIGEQPSEFKKALLELKPGMKILMRGPVGAFYLQDDRPTLFIAGGMGITPFLSMLKQVDAERGNTQKQLELLYAGGEFSHLFKDELDDIAQRTSTKITYVESRDELQQELQKVNDAYSGSGNYFVAGPKAMVEDVAGSLRKAQVPKKRIFKDTFFGY